MRNIPILRISANPLLDSNIPMKRDLDGDHEEEETHRYKVRVMKQNWKPQQGPLLESESITTRRVALVASSASWLVTGRQLQIYSDENSDYDVEYNNKLDLSDKLLSSLYAASLRLPKVAFTPVKTTFHSYVNIQHGSEEIIQRMGRFTLQDAPTSFVLFPRLPSELRIKIWRFASPTTRNGQPRRFLSLTPQIKYVMDAQGTIVESFHHFKVLNVSKLRGSGTKLNQIMGSTEQIFDIGVLGACSESRYEYLQAFKHRLPCGKGPPTQQPPHGQHSIIGTPTIYFDDDTTVHIHNMCAMRKFMSINADDKLWNEILPSFADIKHLSTHAGQFTVVRPLMRATISRFLYFMLSPEQAYLSLLRFKALKSFTLRNDMLYATPATTAYFAFAKADLIRDLHMHNARNQEYYVPRITEERFVLES